MNRILNEKSNIIDIKRIAQAPSDNVRPKINAHKTRLVGLSIHLAIIRWLELRVHPPTNLHMHLSPSPSQLPCKIFSIVCSFIVLYTFFKGVDGLEIFSRTLSWSFRKFKLGTFLAGLTFLTTLFELHIPQESKVLVSD